MKTQMTPNNALRHTAQALGNSGRAISRDAKRRGATLLVAAALIAPMANGAIGAHAASANAVRLPRSVSGEVSFSALCREVPATLVQLHQGETVDGTIEITVNPEAKHAAVYIHDDSNAIELTAGGPTPFAYEVPWDAPLLGCNEEDGMTTVVKYTIHYPPFTTVPVYSKSQF